MTDEQNIEAKKNSIFVAPKAEFSFKNIDQAYSSGIAQHEVVFEDANCKILYKCAIEPDEINFGGAKDRPLVFGEITNIIRSVRSVTVPAC